MQNLPASEHKVHPISKKPRILKSYVYFYKYFKNMRYFYQAYIICNIKFIIHTHLYYF
jgi:hypothetical protein